MAASGVSQQIFNPGPEHLGQLGIGLDFQSTPTGFGLRQGGLLDPHSSRERGLGQTPVPPPKRQRSG
jgi:hypothetical protein